MQRSTKLDLAVLLLYMTKGHTQSEIEEAIKLPKGTVGTILTDYGFPRRQGKGYQRGPCCGLYGKKYRSMTEDEFNNFVWVCMNRYSPGTNQHLGDLIENEIKKKFTQ